MPPPTVPRELQGLGNYLQGWQPEANQWMQQVLGGEFLGQGNPYVQQMIDAFTADAQTAYQRSLPSLDARFSSAGRYGSGAHGGASGIALGDMLRGITSQSAQLRGQTYEAERQRMMEAMGMLSGERQTGMGAIGGGFNALQQKMAQIKSAQMAAAASRYAADRAAAASMANTRLGQMGLAWEMAQGLHGAGVNNAMAPYTQLQGASQLFLPILQGFGTQNTSGVNPGAGVSPLGMGLTGAAGGFMGGKSLGGGQRPQAAPTGIPSWMLPNYGPGR